MALQIVAVNDVAPGACTDVGLVYNGSTTITSSKIIAGTSMTLSENIGITGNGMIGGDLAVIGDLDVGGSITSSMSLAAGQDLIGSSTSDIIFNTDKFTVSGATGDTVIDGTLDVGDDINVDDDINVGGNLVVDGTLDLTNADLVVGGTFLVEGLAQLDNVTLFNEATRFGARSYDPFNNLWLVDMTKQYHGFTTDSAYDISAVVPDGEVGQHIYFKLELKDVNNVVITPDNLGDGTTVTLDATGEFCHLVYSGSAWQILASTGTLA
jgi:hypothetical protein